MFKLNFIKEFELKYNHTFIRIQNTCKDKKEVILINHVMNYDRDAEDSDYYMPTINVDHNIVVSGTTSEEEESRIALNDYIIDTTALTAGYKNIDGRAIYLSKEPVQQYKYALSYYALDPHNLAQLPDRGKVRQVQLMYDSTYLDINSAVSAILAGEATSKAIARRYAVGRYDTSRGVFLLCVGVPIGLLDINNEGEVFVHLPPQYKYLSEDIIQHIALRHIK